LSGQTGSINQLEIPTMKKLFLIAASAVLLSTSAFAGPYDGEPGTPIFTIPSAMIVSANLSACCDGKKPAGDAATNYQFWPNHSGVPNGAPYRGSVLDRSSSY
jgi:hypothetical protein